MKPCFKSLIQHYGPSQVWVTMPGLRCARFNLKSSQNQKPGLARRNRSNAQPNLEIRQLGPFSHIVTRALRRRYDVASILGSLEIRTDQLVHLRFESRWESLPPVAKGPEPPTSCTNYSFY